MIHPLYRVTSFTPLGGYTPQCKEHSTKGFDGWYNHGYTQPMKTVISIPDALFKSAEQLAARLGVSRSELYQKALLHFLESQDDAAITEQLNQVYASEEESRLDPVLERLQGASLAREKW